MKPRHPIIYALTDPRTDEIRYIGKSVHGLARARSHLEPKRIATDSNLHKARWLRSLVGSGLRAGIVVLQECADDAALLVAEREWIARGRASGWQLTNLTDGGDGAAGYCPPPETRARMSAAQRRRVRPPSLGEKVRASKLGKPRPDLTARNNTDAGRAHLARLHEMARGRARPELAERNSSPENRAKVRDALKGRVYSPETIERMRLGQQRRRARARGAAP